MFKVIGSDNRVYGLVDTRVQAEAIIKMKQLGRDGKPPPLNPNNTTAVSRLSFSIVEVPDSEHP